MTAPEHVTVPSLVILGAGEDQLPAYLEGRRLGYHVVGVDQRADALAGPVSDEFLQVTTRDAEAIASRLGERPVAAVISPASDAAQASVAALSRRYGCPRVGSELAVRASVDKGFFRRTLTGLGYPQPGYLQSRDPAVLASAGQRLRLPVVVKPADSSGSKGLTMCREASDLPSAVALALRHSFRGEIIIEELVHGRHFSMEQFMYRGEPALTVVTERQLAGSRHMVSGAHILPADLPSPLATRLREMSATVLAELGHRDGPVNIDFVLSGDDEIYLIELNARLGGNGMPMLTREAYGVNTVEATIRLAVGDPVRPVPRQSPKHVMLQILQAPRAGILAGVSGVAEAMAVPGIIDLRLFASAGDHVLPYTQASHKLGYLLAATEERSGLLAAVELAQKALDIRICDDPKESG